MCQVDQSHESLDEASNHSSEEELLALSYCAAARIQGKKTMRLRGIINNHEVLILIDSGSSGTFVSDKLVRELKLKTFRVPQSQVSVADGSKMLSDSAVQDLTWFAQGHEFQSDARVLSLGCYDIILGMDWLESHSTMWVDWKRKRMRFSYKGSRVVLTGVKDCISKCLSLKVSKLQGMLRKRVVAQLVELTHISLQDKQQDDSMPPAIQQLVHHYDGLFQDPHTLPPQRPFDHSIPLIE
jgi:5S rRNA maturation endonuclease (ribonuclease M5)